MKRPIAKQDTNKLAFIEELSKYIDHLETQNKKQQKVLDRIGEILVVYDPPLHAKTIAAELTKLIK